MRGQVVITGKRAAGQEIVHGFVELDAHGRVLMIDQNIHPHARFLAHADLDVIRHFQQGLNAAGLPQPQDEVVIKGLVALGADIDGLAQPIGVQGDDSPAVQ